MTAEEEAKKQISTSVFAVRTTAGQEKNVADMIASKVKSGKLPIKAVFVPEMLKGYVFLEAEGPHFVEQAIGGIKHVRSRVPGLVSFSEVERYIVVKPVIEELGPDDLVEVVVGLVETNAYVCVDREELGLQEGPLRDYFRKYAAYMSYLIIDLGCLHRQTSSIRV